MDLEFLSLVFILYFKPEKRETKTLTWLYNHKSWKHLFRATFKRDGRENKIIAISWIRHLVPRKVFNLTFLLRNMTWDIAFAWFIHKTTVVGFYIWSFLKIELCQNIVFKHSYHFFCNELCWTWVIVFRVINIKHHTSLNLDLSVFKHIFSIELLVLKMSNNMTSKLY